MKTIIVGLAGLLLPLLASGPVAAWAHANYHGGTTSHTPGSGSTTRTDAAGGSETHTYGQGTTATGRYGDTATHQEGSNSTSFSNPHGGSATHTYGQGTTATSAKRRHRLPPGRVGVHNRHRRLRRQRHPLLRVWHDRDHSLRHHGLPQRLLRHDGLQPGLPSAHHGELLRVRVL